ncbi:MptD family putative ECF transporter S component [Dermatophilus congolensis]|uniref:Conserved hypothetical integral membrane protein n=1 Tax=Dermatophilus congolensis TaxID=1863 RepID=A0AA46H078_9MICO|nr:MptD family putative ECF transporter S component [Dermatophilus congolensis]MBO3142734.1 MptD family putative ECF transporter S component [Dermatophilus congolensis]MBO3151726.1 MptD family putative ECF transporter S component [Dermatophilus congolensis]MBO3161273.1 MptD family putative ECF transporter S component [Dermatophilus congolensis]MBO3163008.1 MptD family putative ECF transporter S component [Dermatophilus congolensis]MBO3176560.1 MptD family putative ECF transporter S component [
MTNQSTSDSASAPSSQALVPDSQGSASAVKKPWFTARDLITVGIFGAIYAVLNYAFGMLGMFGPLVWLLSVPPAIIINGITFVLFYKRVRKPGMIFLFSLILSIVFVLHGGALLGAIATPIVAFIVEFVARAGDYRTRASAIASYTLFGLTAFTPFVPILLNADTYFQTPAWQAMGPEFIAAAQQVFTVPMLLGLAVACPVSGFLGGLLGTAVVRKHFQRAGLA